MRIVITLCMLCSFWVSAQDLIWLETKEKLKSKELTLRGLEKLLYNDKKDYDVDSELFDYRDIHKKFINKYVLFSIYDRGNSYYFLNTIVRKNTIIYLELRHTDSTKSEIKYQKPMYASLIELHNEAYNIKADVNHPYFNKINKTILGFDCFSSGSHSQEYDDLQLLLDSNNIEEIRKWSYSLTPEIRCVGAVGLYCYQKKGNTLTEADLVLMNQVAEEKTEIYGCEGYDEHGLIFNVAEVYKRGCKFLGGK